MRTCRPATSTLLAALVLLCGVLSGCRLMRPEDVARYETVATDPTRDTQAAALYHERALKIIDRASDPACCECLAGCTCNIHKAEALLQKALLADVRYGPAHNTLGMLYFYQHKLYLAAWEFEYASRMMPDYAEPLNNLGLTYEAAERLGPAMGYYEMAVELAPTNPVYLGNLAKVQLRQGYDVEAVRGLLQEVIFYDTRPEWVAWARDTVGLNPIQLASAESDDTSGDTSTGEGNNSDSLPTPSPPESIPTPTSTAPPSPKPQPLSFPAEITPVIAPEDFGS